MKNLEEYFDELTGHTEPSNLYSPIQSILTQGGKRLRPKLVMLGADLFGCPVEKTFHAAAAFEMLHNFTLIHDDIMDEAPIRRGKPTVYRKWNSNIAILSGDALSAMALKEILKSEDSKETIIKLSTLLADTAIEVCEGQQYDLDFESIDNITIPQYVEMIRLKTAVLLAACLKAGAIIAGTSVENQNAIKEYGINLGLAFQLKDDLLDIYADDSIFGKVNGGDIKVNKKTYPYLRAIEDSSPEQKRTLLHYFSSTDFDFDEKFSAVTAIYETLSIREKTEQAIEEYVQKGLAALDSITVEPHQKEKLHNIIIELSNRNK